MVLVIQFFLWISVFALFHSYVLYPWLLRWLTKGKMPNTTTFEPAADELPTIAFLMSAYNEAKVIAAKLDSLLVSHYPKDKLHIYIGSDCSSDSTHDIIRSYQARFQHLTFFPFEQRRGKPSVINDLARTALQEHSDKKSLIFTISDANVLLTPDAIFQLAKHFKNPAIALVDSNIQPPQKKSVNQVGIAGSEQNYISREVYIKHREGLAWGAMVGPLGGCYAIRASHFREVPARNLVDDFYIGMNALALDGQAINELHALCFEDNPSHIADEFRRKVRISTGNFTNLASFWKLLFWWKRPSVSFAFWSHKVLRWLGPFFILIAYSCLIILAFVYQSFFYLILFGLQSAGLFLIPLLDIILQKFNIHLKLLRYITYFLAMNLALLKGFFNYIRGVQQGIWQPTKRV